LYTLPSRFGILSVSPLDSSSHFTSRRLNLFNTSLAPTVCSRTGCIALWLPALYRRMSTAMNLAHLPVCTFHQRPPVADQTKQDTTHASARAPPPPRGESRRRTRPVMVVAKTKWCHLAMRATTPRRSQLLKRSSRHHPVDGQPTRPSGDQPLRSSECLANVRE